MALLKHDANQKGSVILEAALSLMTLMLFLIGIIEGGRMVWTYNTVAFVAREGTRYATIRGADSTSPASNATVDAYVTARGQALGLDPAKMHPPFTTGAGQPSGSFVQVQFGYAYSTMTTIFVSVPIELTSTSRTVILH